ncbi:HNH endonuclease [Planctomicrobium sp. SH668]|uniref:HNH endonuclease n=1 Tax=Planctomicrobium sp. SH668 TaxID=3448126 RepID=UPI003F5C43CB
MNKTQHVAKYWCVNFDDIACLHHGIHHNCWLMGYQYKKRGVDTSSRKAAITRNWKRLAEISVGDQFVAYLKGRKYFATGMVRSPRRAKSTNDHSDSIVNYLQHGKPYTDGYVYFSPGVVYENFTDKISHYPVRIDVDAWEDFSPDGVHVKGPVIPRHKTVYAAFEIDQEHFELIKRSLSGTEFRATIPEEVDPNQTFREGATKTVTINAYERSRAARARCIEHFGWSCAVCSFDMTELYGHHGKGVIHVHHLKDLASLGKEYEIDPIKDLRPVCPNCHSVLHASTPALSIKQLRQSLKDQKSVRWPKSSG